MFCMKCGREMETEQSFCEICLEEMKKYPVKPGTPVQLPPPVRTHTARKPVVRRRTVNPEEQVKTLKKRVRVLFLLLLVAILMVLTMLHPTVNYYTRKYHLRPGQNYSTITPTETTRPRR